MDRGGECGDGTEWCDRLSNNSLFLSNIIPISQEFCLFQSNSSYETPIPPGGLLLAKEECSSFLGWMTRDNRVAILICRSTKTNIISWNNIWRLLLMPIYKYMYSRSHQSTQPKETMESNLQCLIFCWKVPAYLILAQTVCEMSLS